MDDVKSNHKSVNITKNGEAAGVLISPEDYDRWVERDRLLQAIEQGLMDSKSGKILSDKVPPLCLIEINNRYVCGKGTIWNITLPICRTSNLFWDRMRTNQIGSIRW
jgi:prevent-host-death family protein